MGVAGLTVTAQFIPIGEPAHDAERQALRFLVDGLPADYTVYGNPWLVERSGVIFELDAVVVAPHAIFVVETKAYRGRIEGTDNDWWLPERIRSPLKLNRITAQALKTHLRSASYQAGQVWTEGLVFLSATTDVGVRGPASADRVLRIYSVPPLATDAQRERVAERARWEAQVLGRLGRSEGILSADPPFADEAGIVLPLECFQGITLTTWVERYGPDVRGKEGKDRADLRGRTDL